MATNEPYYGTAPRVAELPSCVETKWSGWEQPPDWLTEAHIGDVVPEGWSIVGPYDRETNKPYVDIDD